MPGSILDKMVLGMLAGLLPAAIARWKGQNFFLWWLYGALLFFVALAHALLLSAVKRPGSGVPVS